MENQELKQADEKSLETSSVEPVGICGKECKCMQMSNLDEMEACSDVLDNNKDIILSETHAKIIELLKGFTNIKVKKKGKKTVVKSYDDAEPFFIAVGKFIKGLFVKPKKK